MCWVGDRAHRYARHLMSSLGSLPDGSARFRARLAVLVLVILSVAGTVSASMVAAQSEDEEVTQPTILPTTTTESTTTTEFFETTTTTEYVEPTTTTEDQFTPTTDFDETDAFDDDEVEETTTTEATSTSIRNLLVEGDGTEGAQSTTTTSTTVVGVEGDDAGVSESTIIWLIVAGLVVISGLIALWTWRFWRATRPAPVPVAAASETSDRTSVFRNP